MTRRFIGEDAVGIHFAIGARGQRESVARKFSNLMDIFERDAFLEHNGAAAQIANGRAVIACDKLG